VEYSIACPPLESTNGIRKNRIYKLRGKSYDIDELYNCAKKRAIRNSYDYEDRYAKDDDLMNKIEFEDLSKAYQARVKRKSVLPIDKSEYCKIIKDAYKKVKEALGIKYRIPEWHGTIIYEAEFKFGEDGDEGDLYDMPKNATISLDENVSYLRLIRKHDTAFGDRFNLLFVAKMVLDQSSVDDIKNDDIVNPPNPLEIPMYCSIEICINDDSNSNSNSNAASAANSNSTSYGDLYDNVIDMTGYRYIVVKIYDNLKDATNNVKTRYDKFSNLFISKHPLNLDKVQCVQCNSACSSNAINSNAQSAISGQSISQSNGQSTDDGGGGTKKKKAKSYIKTSRTFTGKDGVKRVIYTNNGKSYVKRKSPKTGKFQMRVVQYSAGTTKVKHGLYGLYTTLRKVAISASIFCYGCFRKFQQADDYLRIFERTYFTSDNHCTVL